MTSVHMPEWRNIGELLGAKAKFFGDAQFAEVSGVPLSYLELERRSLNMARGLRALGVRKGDRVATFMFNAPEQMISLFGITRMGAVWTPINAGLVGKDLIHTLSDSGARILITDPENKPRIDALPTELLENVTVFFVGDAPAGRRFDEIEEAGALQPQDVAVAGEDAVLASDPAVILYTGGTTGLPKGVVLSHYSFILAGVRYGEVFGVTAGERHFTTLPLFHAAALQFAVMGPLVNDMTTVLDRRFSASGYWQRVRETKANLIDPIGSMLSMLCAQPEREDDTRHSVRICVGIFGQVPPEVPEMFSRRFNVPMVAIYGLTEAGGAMITSDRLGAQVEGSVGKPYGWADIRIAGDDDQPVEPGTVGEILLRPTYPHMFMLRYHNNPEKTLEALGNLWFHTGDLGRMDEEGNLFFIGRKAHWIRRRGENISAYEVEDAIQEMPGVAEVVVVGVPSELGEDDIKAFVIPEKGISLPPEEIVVWCRERIAPFKIPRFVEFVEDFPRSVTKREIERGVLKKMTNDKAWDREREMGRLSWQAAR